MTSSPEALNKFIKQVITLKAKRDVKELVNKHERMFTAEDEARQRLIAHIEDSLDSTERNFATLSNVVYCLEFFVQTITENMTTEKNKLRESFTTTVILFLKNTYIGLDALSSVKSFLTQPKMELKQLKLDTVHMLKRLMIPPAQGASFLPVALDMLQTFTMMIRDSDTETVNACKVIDDAFFKILETEHYKVKNHFNIVETLTHLAGCLADNHSKVQTWALKSLKRLLEIEKLELWRHIQHFLK